MGSAVQLEIKNIVKKYGSKFALDDFSLSLSNGVYGLLGPNGAGKTTLINIIVQILAADQGTIRYNGQDVRELKDAYIETIGFLPQMPRFYDNYTAVEFLNYIAVLKDIDRKQRKDKIAGLLKIVNLTDVGKKRIGAYSGGMKQRLGIAQALLNDPKILILDEPTAGLDPKERMRFRNLISQLSEDRIVILATHIVSDIEYIAKEVILISAGKLIAQAPPHKLTALLEGRVWDLPGTDPKELQAYLRNYRVSNVNYENQSFYARIVSETKPNENAHAVAASLEDVYLYYFGDQ